MAGTTATQPWACQTINTPADRPHTDKVWIALFCYLCSAFKHLV